MAAEREIKTVLTLDDASFSKGLKAAASDVKAAQLEMQAAITGAGGLAKGFKRAQAQVTGLNKIMKAQKNQMAVLNKEYKTQQQRLTEAGKALREAREKNEENSAEVKKAANAYAGQTAAVNNLREKMAKLQIQMNQNKSALRNTLTQPLQAAQRMISTAMKMSMAALAAGGAALAKFTAASNESKKDFNSALAESRGTFEEWSLFLEKSAESAWKSLGLSQAAYLEAAADIGQKLQDAGMPVRQSAEWVQQAMELAGQLSDQYGVPVAQVLDDISAAAAGDEKALRKYGVQVGVLNGKMSDSERAAAILKSAMESAAKGAEDLDGRVAQSVNNSGEKLKAAWENFKAGAGTSEDVAEAAAAAAGNFAAEFTANLSTGLKVAPVMFRSFTSSFKSGWKKSVWPELAPLINQTFSLDVPDDWEEFKRLLKQGWDMAKDDITGILATPFKILMPGGVVDSINKWWNETSKKINLTLGVNILPTYGSENTEKIMQAAEASNIDIRTARPKEVQNLFKSLFGHAGGLSYVPIDNYLARLHRGEMVLTADQAARYRAQAATGGATTTYNDSAAIYIDKYNQYSDADAQGLLNQMQMMQRRQRMGYGLS